jgi:hypothetical protein
VRHHTRSPVAQRPVRRVRGHLGGARGVARAEGARAGARPHGRRAKTKPRRDLRGTDPAPAARRLCGPIKRGRAPSLGHAVRPKPCTRSRGACAALRVASSRGEAAN